MSYLNALLRPLFDALLAPFRSMDPLVGLSVASLATAIGMLVAFKHTSNQDALEAVKRRIYACLFEIRLYNDDFLAIMRAQWEILRHNLTYMKHSLAPMVWVMPPLVLVIAQLQFHYGYVGLPEGQPAVVTAHLRAGSGSAKPAASLVAPDGVTVETPAVWMPAERELAWRISGQRAGEYALSVELDGASETKTLRVGDGLARLSPIRVDGSFLDQLLYPAEPPLPSSSPIESITVSYPGRDIDVAGWGMHWMIVYFVLSIVFAFALRKPFGVVI